MHQSFPQFMRFSPEEMLNATTSIGLTIGRPEGMSQVDALFLICIHAGEMHTEFLLQRAMINRMKTDTKQLIPVARQMLGLVLLAMSKRDFLRDFQGDLVYLVSSAHFRISDPDSAHIRILWLTIASSRFTAYQAQAYWPSSCSNRSSRANTHRIYCQDLRRSKI